MTLREANDIWYKERYPVVSAGRDERDTGPVQQDWEEYVQELIDDGELEPLGEDDDYPAFFSVE